MSTLSLYHPAATIHVVNKDFVVVRMSIWHPHFIPSNAELTVKLFRGDSNLADISHRVHHFYGSWEGIKLAFCCGSGLTTGLWFE